MGSLSEQQIDEIRDTIQKTRDLFEEYDRKIRAMTVGDLERRQAEVRDLRKSMIEYLQKSHSGVNHGTLDNDTLLVLIGKTMASLRDLATAIVTLSIETSAAHISAAVEQVKHAKEKADDAFGGLQDIKKALQILAKLINLAGAIAVTVVNPNISNLFNIFNAAGEVIESIA